MKLCYQVATPDVAIADSVTAYQGPLEKSFSDLAKLGYQGVELMTLNPSELDWEFVKKEAEKNGLKVVLVCTGEIFGQLGLSYTNPDPEKRKEAIRRSKEIIDFAAYLGANINIGRIRGQYCSELTKEQTEELAIAAFRELAEKTNFAFESPEDLEHTVADGISYESPFYLSETGVVFYYAPYEIASYAEGFPEVTIPYSELEMRIELSK